MSEDNDSASGRQVISRAAAVLRALAEQQRPEPGPDREEDGPAAHHRAPHRRGAGSAAAGRHHARRRPTRPGAGAAGGLGAYRRGRRRAPFVEALGRRLRETVDLCVFRGQHAVSVDQFASDQELRVVAAVGTAYPIHCTAHGKALLARLDDAALEGCWARGWNAAPPAPSPRARICWRSWPRSGPGAGHWTWRNTRSASAGSACISRPANPSSTRCRSRCRPRATKGSSTPAWRPCSSARPRLNPCWPADRAAALGRRRRDGRSCGEGLKCNEIFNFSLHQAVIQAQPRRRSGARAVHPCFPPQDFSVPGP